MLIKDNKQNSHNHPIPNRYAYFRDNQKKIRYLLGCFKIHSSLSAGPMRGYYKPYITQIDY